MLLAACALFVGTPRQEFKPLPPLVQTVELDAPLAQVWDLFTTKHGIEKWMVTKGEIDLRLGGLMRSTYNPNGSIDDEGSIHNQIICLDPMKFYSIKCVKTPKTFPFKEAIQNMYTTVYFDELSPNRTRVTLRGLGYTTEPNSAKMREFFDQGNSGLVKKLQEIIPPKQVALEPAMKEVGRLVGGVWTSDVTKARLRFEWCMDGKAVKGTSRIAIGTPNEMEAIAVFTWDPEAKKVSYMDFHGPDTVYKGHVALENGVMTYDFGTLIGKPGTYRFQEQFVGENELKVVLFQNKEGKWAPVFDTVYKREIK